MINDHQIDAKVLNKIENRLESWCDHHGFVTVDDQSKKYHKEFSGILYQSAVGSTTFFAKRSGLGSKPCFGGLKPSKTRSNFWGGFVICIEKTFWKKIGPKRPFQPSAVVRPKMTRLYGVAATN